MYDVVIIGSGPAGLSAAIYAERAGLNTIVLEKNPMSGGQVLNTYEVDNYPGFPGISGLELGMKFKEHAEKVGVTFTEAEVLRLNSNEKVKEVVTDQATYTTKTVIIATGASHAKLGVGGEEKLMGRGVSYCATCDGAFFKNKVVAVVGGGDVAVEDAIFLARTCQKVYVIHRRDELRAANVLQKALMELNNVEILWDCIVEEIKGEEQVESIRIKDKNTNESRELMLSGVFVAVGIQPNTNAFVETMDMDSAGYIIAGEDCMTNKAGVYAAGDVRKKPLRQIVTAVSDGANAVISIQEYLLGQ